MFPPLKTRIRQAAAQADSTAVNHLLVGCLLALEGRYTAALESLGTGRRIAYPGIMSDLMFVSAVIRRKLYHEGGACLLLAEAIKIRRADPRFQVELAKAPSGFAPATAWQDSQAGIRSMRPSISWRRLSPD